MKKLCLALLLIVAAGSSFAQIKNNVTKATITFELKNLGVKTGGTIGGIEANIAFDPSKPETGKIEATAEVNTINTGNDRRDNHLRQPDYFNVAAYPKLSMSSVGFKRKGGNNYVGQFNLTIKGKTKLIDVPFTYMVAGNTATFKGSYKIMRLDFGIGGNSMTMSDDVTIFIEATTTK